MAICLLCHDSCQNPYDLCSACENDLPWNTASRNVITLFDYEHPVDYWITQLKFHQHLIYAKLLGQLLTRKISQYPLPQLIIPVPLHKKRLQERGFNQALEIAKIISKNLNIKIDKTSVIRKKYTQPQTLLKSSERHQNLKGAFELIKPIQVSHIAIIDDVITTGETVQELSKILNIKKIDIWCCALA